MASDEVATLDRASLERFTTELIRAGFEPVEPGGRAWEGPIAAPFAPLTRATRMRIRIPDGWPFLPPQVFVRGLASEHVTAGGWVCLWQSGAAGGEWRTLDGLLGRITTWCDRARTGFRGADALLDAHAYFQPFSLALAVFDPASLIPAGTDNGVIGRFHGKQLNPLLVRLLPGEGAAGDLRGEWYFRRKVRVVPSNLDAFREALTKAQRASFHRGTRNTRASGDRPINLAALVWETPHGRNSLIIRMKADQGALTAESLEAAPDDEATLLLRAGPDAPALRPRRVVLFGAGALGSHVALLLAESGVGRLRVIDGDVLRPSNLVRHAAAPEHTGFPKVYAVRELVKKAPWTAVEAIPEYPWSPVQLERHLKAADLAVETTGMSPFAEQLSILAARQGVPLVTSALYRGGSVGRIRRQRPDADPPISERARADSPFPIIPPGVAEEEIAGVEIGCSATINNAPPAAVTALASLTTQVAIDTLLAREDFGPEVIEVYRPLDVAPFDRPGRLTPGWVRSHESHLAV